MQNKKENLVENNTKKLNEEKLENCKVANKKNNKETNLVKNEANKKTVKPSKTSVEKVNANLKENESINVENVKIEECKEDKKKNSKESLKGNLEKDNNKKRSIKSVSTSSRNLKSKEKENESTKISKVVENENKSVLSKTEDKKENEELSETSLEESKTKSVLKNLVVEEEKLEKALDNLNTTKTKEIEDNKLENNKRIKVLYVVSECHPFCATGGLADVAEGLPKFINNNSDIDMRVILPMYSDIPNEYRSKFTFIGHKYIPVAWRSVYCGLFTFKLNGVTYYFLDNEYYFKRGGGIYSYYDDGERFAFTSRAVIELIDLMNFLPDIIHCNDWQSALIPIYLKTNYVNDGKLNKIKTVFTLHNTEYQGKFDLKILGDVFGIDNRYTNIVEYNKDINLVKGAICCCDKFTTVSPSYSQEILSPEHSNGLDFILRQNAYKICGILNAIDCDFYNPLTDPVLYKNYDINSYKDKIINKTQFQKELGLEVNESIPMVCIVTRMAKHKGLDLIKSCIEGFISSGSIQFVAVGGGAPEYENYFRYLEGKYKGRVKALLGYSNVFGRKAYGASDIFLMPSKSEPCGLAQMIASRYGAIPIVRETGGLKDSMWDFGCVGGGNAYTFSNYNTHDLVYSINRAINDYKNKPLWEERIKICMSRDFSWQHSAKGFINIYNKLTNK